MNYLYNGKEWNNEGGLGWLDYGFRWYDPAVGRFPSVDPLADRFAHVSPFNYAENEPIAYIDLWGLQKLHFTYKFAIQTKPKVPGWVPFGAWFVNASLSEGSITDFNIDFDAPRSYSGRFEVPARISPTGGGYEVSAWDIYNSSGDNLEEVFNPNNWERESNLGRAFAEGLVAGWNTAALEGAGELIFSKLYSSALSGLSRTINANKQASHIVGTNSFKIRKSQGKNPSILTGDAQSLLDDVFNANIKSIQKAGDKYRVDFGRIIGQYVDKDTGEAVETTVGLISTGKKGAHIVPGRPID
jgi:RHS repeat-associated protein